MSVQRNKEIARLYIDRAIGQAERGLFDDLFADDAKTVNPRLGREVPAKQAYAQDVQNRNKLSEFRATIDLIIGEQDTVVVYWRCAGKHDEMFCGAPPTGKQIETRNLTILRFQDGKIVHSETIVDRLALFVALESLGDHLPVFFDSELLEDRPALRNDLRPRTRRPALEQAEQGAIKAFAKIRAGDDVVEGVRRAMGHFGPPKPRPTFDGVDLIGVDANGIRAEWVVPKGASHRHRVVHCHGGGWIAGGIEIVRTRAVALARLAQACVLIFDYRLAPEHPFPAGLDDCYTMLEWAGKNGPDGPDEDPNQPLTLTLSGDSAGASLAVATCARAIARGTRKPDTMALLSGQLSIVPHRDRVARNDKLVFQDRLWYAYGVYAKDTPASDPRISPLHTPLETLAQFPPILLQVSGDELFLWDARVFADRLLAADARCVLSVWPEMIHCWHSLLDLATEAKDALEEVANFIRPRPTRT